MGAHAGAVADRDELAPARGEAEPGVEQSDAEAEPQGEQDPELRTVLRADDDQEAPLPRP